MFLQSTVRCGALLNCFCVIEQCTDEERIGMVLRSLRGLESQWLTFLSTHLTGTDVIVPPGIKVVLACALSVLGMFLMAPAKDRVDSSSMDLGAKAAIINPGLPLLPHRQAVACSCL